MTMSNFTLILFSDIHFGCRPLENQNPVIEGFCKDVKDSCHKRNGEKFLFCIGDLVQAADSNQLYQDFKENILEKISKECEIPNENFLLIPGNHDAQKTVIEGIKEERFKKVKSHLSEGKFNDYLENEPSIIRPFENFMGISSEYINSKWDKSSIKDFSINKEWKVACLNSALLTFAHIDEIKDSKYLCVDTRSLSKWISDNQESKKILLMHHPLEELSDWAREELISLINTNFNLVVTGHTHSQFASTPLGAEVSSIHCQLPHLFHDKSEDAMGYAIIDFRSNVPYQIEYREWNNRRHRFVPGTSFVDDDLGVLELESFHAMKKAMETASAVENDIDLMLKEAMKVYCNIPELEWEDRFVSRHPVEAYMKIPKEELIGEDEVVKMNGDIMVLSPRDFGLTCYGLHFAKMLCSKHNEIPIFIDNPNCKLNKLKDQIQNKVKSYNISEKDIHWFIIDEWILPKEQEKELLSYLHESYPGVRLFLLSPRSERFFTKSDLLGNHKETQYLYLTPLSRPQLRHLASTFNQFRYIAEEDILLKRLDNDIRSFNMHRSPMNCINLLYVFGSAFDRNPVNRTEVLQRVLNLIFENDTPPVYSTTPDLKDCIRVLGLLSRKMIMEQVFTFSKTSFIEFVNGYSINQDLKVDSEYLFRLLLRNHIIMPELDKFRFKASYWVYFFAACRMQVDREFTKYLIEDMHYLNYPLILEFYSGLSREENEIIKKVTSDLDVVSANVKEKLRLPKGWAPYNLIKVKSSDAQKRRVLDCLDNEIRGSNLPS